jgi:hypothetical protein
MRGKAMNGTNATITRLRERTGTPATVTGRPKYPPTLQNPAVSRRGPGLDF